MPERDQACAWEALCISGLRDAGNAAAQQSGRTGSGTRTLLSNGKEAWRWRRRSLQPPLCRHLCGVQRS